MCTAWEKWEKKCMFVKLFENTFPHFRWGQWTWRRGVCAEGSGPLALTTQMMTGNLKVKQSAGIKPGTYRRVLKWCETEQNSPERGSCHSGGGRRSSVTMDDHTGKRHRKLQSQRPQLTIRKLCRLNFTYKSIKLYHLQIIRCFEDSCEGPQRSFF